MKLEKALRQEAEKLEAMKKERMVEVLRLKKKDENICHKMEMDPFHLSTTVVPSTTQLNGLKEHIRTMEEEKFDREERFVTMKETILKRYMELEEEPETEFERYLLSRRLVTLLYQYISCHREIACEDIEVFILSTTNLQRVKEVLSMLDNMLAQNQRTTLNAVEKIESLYERLKLDSNEKYQFLSMHQVRETKSN